MAEFEEKLNSILGNEKAMGQIMALARSLSGENGPQGDGTQSAEEVPAQSPEQSGPSDGSWDLSSLLGQIDPRMLQIGVQVLREYQSTDDRNAALLSALRPFLREERRARLDRAQQIPRMTRVIRVALTAMGRKEEEGSV